MMRRTKADWQKVIDAWARSGLSTAEFADAQGIHPKTLTFWKWRLGKEKRGKPRRDKVEAASTSFTEVTVPLNAPIELVVGDVTVRVPAGASAEQLREVLGVLRGSS